MWLLRLFPVFLHCIILHAWNHLDQVSRSNPDKMAEVFPRCTIVRVIALISATVNITFASYSYQTSFIWFELFHFSCAFGDRKYTDRNSVRNFNYFIQRIAAIHFGTWSTLWADQKVLLNSFTLADRDMLWSIFPCQGHIHQHLSQPSEGGSTLHASTSSRD